MPLTVKRCMERQVCDMFMISAEGAFDSAHFLKGYDGKCANLHGHRWRVICEVSSEQLKETGMTRGMVMDFGDIKDALKSLVDAFDHKLVVEKGSLKDHTLEILASEGFEIITTDFIPTAECFAHHFFHALEAKEIPVSAVTVYETPTNGATYRSCEVKQR